MNPDAFTKMKKLRLLIVHNADISGSRLDFLSNELRLLDWPGYPFSSLPSNFGPNKLVAVDMSYSRVKKLIMCSKVLIFYTSTYEKLIMCFKVQIFYSSTYLLFYFLMSMN